MNTKIFLRILPYVILLFGSYILFDTILDLFDYSTNGLAKEILFLKGLLATLGSLLLAATCEIISQVIEKRKLQKKIC